MLMLSMLIVIRLHALYRHTSTGRQFALAEDLSHDMESVPNRFIRVHFVGEVWYGQLSHIVTRF